MELSKIFLNMIFKGKTTVLSHSKSICPEMPSDPAALFGLRLRISVKISASEKCTLSIRLSVRKVKLGIVEEFIINVH